MTTWDVDTAVCAHFGITPNELYGPSRAPQFAWPRQVAMYLAHVMLDIPSWKVAGHYFRHCHTCVLHAKKKVAKQIERDEELFRFICKVTSVRDIERAANVA